MKLIAKHNSQTFEIVEDLPEVGYYLNVYPLNGENTHDYLQESLEMAMQFAFEEFGVPLESWAESQD